ncbi:3-oxoacyl-ACP reductase FabG [Nocardioides endophyticus]|uniref:3-oxoacyl-ACP reductase FabG n=1 Tax=Nocardioides endophyticus TaxID=1353775 RepID=A0ABP8YGV1_9ACTN
MTDLTGKIAVVTGSGRGLGREMAIALAQAGASVVVTARTEPQIESVAAEIVAAGGAALAIPADVADEASVDELVDATMRTFGRIDIVVNNSGILATSDLLSQSKADWDRVIEINLGGTYLVTRAFGRHLTAQGHGKVINIASNFAMMGVSHHAAYSASKAAVLGFTRAMAIEWARFGVQVNALAPGYFATDMNATYRQDEESLKRLVSAIPARRLGEASELAPWLLLLASSASDFMTGEVVVIDGGQATR